MPFDLEINDASLWSNALFGKANLGDKRLTKRLVQMGTQLSKSTGASLAKSCEGDSALLEGGYRFLRNDSVSAEAIAASGHEATACLADDISLILAIEDTTSVVYPHEVTKELGYTGSKVDAKHKGYLVHSTMLVDATTRKTIGLVAQNRWCRADTDYGKRAHRAKRCYQEKESYKWEKNSKAISERLGAKKMERTLSVCDRDADVYEYIQYKLERNERFIIRACQNRQLTSSRKTLFNYLSDVTPLGKYEVEIAQKSHRKKRKVELSLSASTVILPPPAGKRKAEHLKPVTLNVVHAREIVSNSQESALEWVLLTTEDISTFEKTRNITRYYELRWRIEDFHKAWKSGTKVEGLRMQSSENLEKMLVLLSFVAIRLLQLKEHFEQDKFTTLPEGARNKCTEVLNDTEWKVLWRTATKSALPKEPPTASWAFKAIARLGGWTDSKKTGKVSWATIWNGWFKLNERVKGFLLAQQMMAADL